MLSPVEFMRRKAEVWVGFVEPAALWVYRQRVYRAVGFVSLWRHQVFGISGPFCCAPSPPGPKIPPWVTGFGPYGVTRQHKTGGGTWGLRWEMVPARGELPFAGFFYPSPSRGDRIGQRSESCVVCLRDVRLPTCHRAPERRLFTTSLSARPLLE